VESAAEEVDGGETDAGGGGELELHLGL